MSRDFSLSLGRLAVEAEANMKTLNKIFDLPGHVVAFAITCFIYVIGIPFRIFKDEAW